MALVAAEVVADIMRPGKEVVAVALVHASGLELVGAAVVQAGYLQCLFAAKPVAWSPKFQSESSLSGRETPVSQHRCFPQRLG